MINLVLPRSGNYCMKMYSGTGSTTTDHQRTLTLMLAVSSFAVSLLLSDDMVWLPDHPRNCNQAVGLMGWRWKRIKVALIGTASR